MMFFVPDSKADMFTKLVRRLEKQGVLMVSTPKGHTFYHEEDEHKGKMYYISNQFAENLDSDGAQQLEHILIKYLL